MLVFNFENKNNKYKIEHPLTNSNIILYNKSFYICSLIGKNYKT